MAQHSPRRAFNHGRSSGEGRDRRLLDLSCINCQRTLPHVEAWYKRYAPYGLEIVGVHTPEFAFEHVVSNVKAQARRGVKYPVAIDDDYGTWTAYHNNYGRPSTSSTRRVSFATSTTEKAATH